MMKILPISMGYVTRELMGRCNKINRWF